ncbi:MAG: TRAP transporter substrate-binding protein DctP [Bacillota bacterium]
MQKNMNVSLAKITFMTLLIVMVMAVGSVSAQEYELILSSYSIGDTSISGSAMAFEYFKEMVETRTDGDIEVRTFYDSTLGGVGEVTRQTMEGVTVQSSVAYGGVFANFYERYQLLYTPYLFENYRSAWNFFDSEYFEGFKEDASAETGLKILGIFDDGGGFVAFTNNERLIRHPEDLEGLRIRVEEGNAAQQALIEGLGAQTVSLPWGDVTTALASGVAQGQFNAPYVNSFAQFWEVNDYSSWIQFIFNSAVWSISDDWFQQLPEEYQVIIMDTAKEAVTISRGVNTQQTMLAWEEAQDRFEDTYLATPDVMEEWKEVLRPVYFDWITEDFGLDPDYVREFWDAAEEVEEETSYRSKM